MITYLINNHKYLDFQTVIKLFEFSRTYTYRVLIDNKIPFVEYRNRKLYSMNELMEYKRLSDARRYLNEGKPSKDIIELLLKNKTENNEEVH